MQLEATLGVTLPPGYRGFLSQVGSGDFPDVKSSCTVATPFGDHVITCLHSIREVEDLLESAVAPRNMICIGFGHFGMTTCLSVAGVDHGQVFALDTEMRFFWDQATLDRFPALDPSIKKFFQLRDAGSLPERPWGYENLYHIADSFEAFIDKLKPLA